MYYNFVHRTMGGGALDFANSSPSRKRVRSSSTVSSTTSAEMCRDFRLYSNPDMPIVQENAAESERPSSSGVCEAVDTSNITVTFHTADEVDGSMSSKRRRCVTDDECIVSCTSSSSSSLQKCPFPGCNKREREREKNQATRPKDTPALDLQ